MGNLINIQLQRTVLFRFNHIQFLKNLTFCKNQASWLLYIGNNTCFSIHVSWEDHGDCWSLSAAGSSPEGTQTIMCGAACHLWMVPHRRRPSAVCYSKLTHCALDYFWRSMNMHMGQVTKLRLSCCLVLLSIDETAAVLLPGFAINW